MTSRDDNVLALSASVKRRQRIEQRLVRKLIRTAKEAGFPVDSVWDGGEYVAKNGTEKEAMDAVFSVDECTIHFGHEGCKHEHGVYIVLGNDGFDAISDYHCGCKPFDQMIESLNPFIEQLEEGR